MIDLLALGLYLCFISALLTLLSLPSFYIVCKQSVSCCFTHRYQGEEAGGKTSLPLYTASKCVLRAFECTAYYMQ